MKRQIRHTVKVSVLCVMVLVWIPLTGWGKDKSSVIEPPADRAIQPADVYAMTMLLRQKLDGLIAEMGESRDTRPEIGVNNVQPREVFFQALTLFQKAHRLCFEFTQQGYPRLPIPQGEIRPGHVWHVVRTALNRVECVEAALHMPGQQTLPSPDATKTPTDVFKSIVQANRQLNKLLEHEFSPADVYAQVQLANHYSEDLLKTLGRFDEEQDIVLPEMPPYQGGKRPLHVYQRLAACFALIEQVAQLSGLRVLQFDPESIRNVAPSDVYDVASLVVSELYYFSVLVDQKPPKQPDRNHRKLPSHVYQQTALLHTQLQELQRLVESYPNWHTLKP